MNPFPQLASKIISCRQCNRLRTHCANVAKTKKAAYSQQEYWGKPVPGFGDSKAPFWIVGLAPAAHGANRTGRVFTGDKSGEWLYSALFRYGWASSPLSTHSSDSLTLKGVFISCIARCAPPDNRPYPSELENCFPFLEKEWCLLEHPPLILTLGKIAFDQIKKLLRKHYHLERLSSLSFKHGAMYPIEKTHVLCSYHPSQQNTYTKRLTADMWNQVFRKAQTLLEDHSFHE